METTVTTMPDWPALLALEPGLRPAHIDRVDDNFEFAAVDAPAAEEPDYAVTITVPPLIVADLCAMAAVRWLPLQPMPYDPSRGLVRVRVVAGAAGAWYLELDMGNAPDMDSGVVDWETFGPCVSLDHALHAACLAVIRARPSPPPPAA